MNNFYLIAKKAYLLDSNREEDLPIPIFKSFLQLIEENLFFIVLSIFIIITVLFLILLLRKKKNGESNEKEPEIIDPSRTHYQIYSRYKTKNRFYPLNLLFSVYLKY